MDDCRRKTRAKVRLQSGATFAAVVAAAFVANGCTADDDRGARAADQRDAAVADHRDAEYVVEGRRVRLVAGVAETEAAPGSAAKIRTRYFGNEARRDLNGDGREDVVFLLTQETGGTGVFYYVVAALDTAQGYRGSQAVLLGDRIAPQSTEIGTNNIVTVSYADRAPDESFATPPSQAKSIRLLLDAATLQFGQVALDFEGEANPATMKLDMKTWTWMGARYEDGRELRPRQAEAFTLTFGADGRFSATTDCNRLGGAYAAADDRLTFSGVFGTRMFCDGAQEAEFTTMLMSTSGYRFTARGQLMLELETGRGSAEFR
jgi:heat shock protein HslJ